MAALDVLSGRVILELWFVSALDVLTGWVVTMGCGSIWCFNWPSHYNGMWQPWMFNRPRHNKGLWHPWTLKPGESYILVVATLDVLTGRVMAMVCGSLGCFNRPSRIIAMRCGSLWCFISPSHIITMVCVSLGCFNRLSRNYGLWQHWMFYPADS